MAGRASMSTAVGIKVVRFKFARTLDHLRACPRKLPSTVRRVEISFQSKRKEHVGTE